MPPSRGEEPPFQNIAIVGFGLIGGSIALAIRERWPSVRITAVDRPPVLAHARGAARSIAPHTGLPTSAGADLVVLAAPVEQNVRLLSEVAEHLGTDALITDVGGTKRDIVKAAAGLSGSRADVCRRSSDRWSRTRRLCVCARRPVPRETVDSHAGCLDCCWDRSSGWRPSSRAWARSLRRWMPTSTID